MIFISWFFLSIGTLILFTAGLGLLVFPDIYTRLAATGKATTLGQSAILIGVMMQMPLSFDTLKIIFIIVFIILSTPVTSHLVGRAAYLAGIKLTSKTQCDQWGEKNNLLNRSLN